VKIFKEIFWFFFKEIKAIFHKKILKYRLKNRSFQMHHSLHCEINPIPQTSFHQLKIFSVSKDMIYFRFIYTVSSMEDLNLKEFSNCLSFRSLCCPPNPALSSTNFQQLLQTSISLTSFLHKLHFYDPKEDSLRGFDELFKEINKKHHIEIKNPLKNTLLNNPPSKIYTESSSKGNMLNIKETIDGKPIERKLLKMSRVGRNSYSFLEAYEEITKGSEPNEKFAARFFIYPEFPDMKECTIKNISKKYLENRELKLRHPNILNYPHRLYQMKKGSRTLDNISILSELCESNLGTFLDKKPKLTQEQAKSFIQQIIEGLNYLKSQLKDDFPYGNFKPSNILITKEGKIKLDYLNFSCYFAIKASKSVYMAPELRMESRLRIQDLDKCDVWTLGAIYYYLLHGKPAFVEDEDLEVIMNDLISLEFDPTIEENTKILLKKMLDYKKNSRISWEDFCKAFNDEYVFPETSTILKNSLASESKNSNKSEEEEKNTNSKKITGNQLNNGPPNVSSQGSWRGGLEIENDLDGRIDNLNSLQVFISEIMVLIGEMAEVIELEVGNMYVLLHFLRKIVIIRFIEILDEELAKNENQWNYTLILLGDFLKKHPINIEKVVCELKNPRKPLNDIDVMEIINDKAPKTNERFGEILKNVMGELIQGVKKAKDRIMDEKINKRLEFLYNCLGILLDLKKQMKESNSLILRFEDYRKSMGLSDVDSSPFTSQDLNNI